MRCPKPGWQSPENGVEITVWQRHGTKEAHSDVGMRGLEASGIFRGLAHSVVRVPVDHACTVEGGCVPNHLPSRRDGRPCQPRGEDRDRFNQLPAQTLQRADAGHGGFFKMCVLTAKALARPFQWKEFTTFSWFLMTVSLLPTFAMSIPLTVLIISSSTCC